MSATETGTAPGLMNRYVLPPPCTVVVSAVTSTGARGASLAGDAVRGATTSDWTGDDRTGAVAVVSEIVLRTGRGVGKTTGVSTTTSAVSRSARKRRLSIYGTGSYPPGLNGLHRARRRRASHPPRSAPWRSSASMA